MGKWSDLKGTLRTEALPSTYQDKVDAVKRDEFWELKPGDLGEKYKELKSVKADMEKVIDEFNLRLEAVKQLILEWMGNQGINNFKLASGGTLYEIGTPNPKVIDNVQFKKWLKKNYPEMHEGLKMHNATLTSLVKELFEEDKALPPGIEVTYRSSLGLKGGKNGEKD